MKKTVFAMLLVFSVCIGCTRDVPPGNSLSQGWAYAVGSRDELPSDCRDKEFQNIDFLRNLERFLPDREGYIWLRNEFFVPDQLKGKTLSLYLGRITMADETYLNGHLVGQTGKFPPKYFSEWNTNRLYSVSDTILDNEGKNILLVKIYVNSEGAIAGRPGLVPSSQGKVIHFLREFYDSNINIFIAFLTFMLALYHLALYLSRTKDRENLWYGLICLAFSFYLTNFFVTKIPGFDSLGLSYLAYQKMVFFVLFVLAFFMVLFFQAFLGRKEPRWLIITLGLFSIVPIFIILIPQDYKSFFPVRFLINFFFAGPFIYLIFVSIYSAVKKVEWSRALLLGTLPLWFCMGFDIIVHIILKLDDQIYLGAYGFPSMLVTIAFILAKRFVSYHNDVEEYKEKLEVMVDERTRQLNDRNRDLEEAHFIMKRDMVMAENVQKSLFPRDLPSGDEWDLAYSFKPMSGVSGDLYDFYYKEGRLAGVGLFDVSGHGIASGLITILSKSVIFRSFMTGEKEKLGKVMEEINDALIREIGSVDNYLTGILLRFRGRLVEYVNAGHTELLYKRSQSGNVGIVNLEKEDIKGLFLGIEGMRGRYQTIQFEMAKDDVVLIHSDCLNESVNTAGEEYGTERIIESMKNASSQSAQKIRDHILLDFIRFMWPDKAAAASRDDLLVASFLGNAQEYGLKDDFTLVVVRRSS